MGRIKITGVAQIHPRQAQGPNDPGRLGDGALRERPDVATKLNGHEGESPCTQISKPLTTKNAKDTKVLGPFFEAFVDFVVPESPINRVYCEFQVDVPSGLRLLESRLQPVSG